MTAESAKPAEATPATQTVDKSAERSVATPSTTGEASRQAVDSQSSSAAAWSTKSFDNQYLANAQAIPGWTPGKEAYVPPYDYNKHSGLPDGLVPSSPDKKPDAPAGADTRVGAAATVPIGADQAPVKAPTDQAAPANPSDKSPRVTELLNANPELKAQYDRMSHNIDKMDPRLASQAADARQGLDNLVLRTGGPTDGGPQIPPEKARAALDKLNGAMEADPAKLSDMLGSSAENKQAVRDLTVAQALRNFGDTRGVQQTGHQTCAIDGKVVDLARNNPDIAAKIMTDAMTAGPDNKITMPDGRTQVTLDPSFMRPDQLALASRGGESAFGMSMDTRLMTGVLANSVTQQRGEMFVMSGYDGVHPHSQGDSGDRLVNMRTGAIRMEGGRPMDDPGFDSTQQSKLSRIVGDGGMTVTNFSKWTQGAMQTENFRDVRDADTLAAIVREKGTVQVGLNAHILWNDTKIGADGGGHITNIVGVEGSGPNTRFVIQDTNTGQLRSYDARDVMAAINNDPSQRVGAGAQPAVRPNDQAPLPAQPGADAGTPSAGGRLQPEHIMRPGGPHSQPVYDSTSRPHGITSPTDSPDRENPKYEDPFKDGKDRQDQEAARKAERDRQEREWFEALAQKRKSELDQLEKMHKDREEEEKRKALHN